MHIRGRKNKIQNTYKYKNKIIKDKKKLYVCNVIVLLLLVIYKCLMDIRAREKNEIIKNKIK